MKKEYRPSQKGRKKFPYSVMFTEAQVKLVLVYAEKHGLLTERGGGAGNPSVSRVAQFALKQLFGKEWDETGEYNQ